MNKFKRLLNFFVILTLVFSVSVPFTASANTERSKKQLNEQQLRQMQSLVSQQESALKRGPVLNDELKDVDGSKQVSVIVQLSEAPVALEKGRSELTGQTFSASKAASVKKKVQDQQADFEKQLKALNIKYQKGYTYNQVLNGMALTLKADDLEKLAELNDVVRIDPNEKVYALEAEQNDEVGAAMVDSIPHLDIPELWNMGYDGAGVKVAVLDTGIDYDHPEFEGVYKGGYNFVVHDSDYARDRADDDPYETTPKDRPDHMPEFNELGRSFYTNHGTHVAGTIAAVGKNEHNIKGIAPKVDLYAYRVLGAYGNGTFEWVIAGIEKAVDEGMDIINLSLGGQSNSATTPDAIAINNATLAGVTAVIATGNTGSGRGSIGNPASSAFAISVGNSTLTQVTYQAKLAVEAGDYKDEYNAGLMGWKFGQDPSEALSGTYDVVAVPGIGAEKDYEGLDVEGKVVLVSRGEIAFVEKIAAAKKAGAVGLLVHNNTGSGPANILLGDSFAFIPTFDISTEAGNAFREAIEATEDKLGKVTFSDYVQGAIEGDEINDSSSRGPTEPNFDIKPDVVAPGTNIMSSVPAYKRDFPDADYSESYDRFTGTSMATPHVAGIAALLLQKNPDWTPFDLKVAISNTAKQLDTDRYDVFAQGPGRVQPLKAATAEALAYSIEEIDESHYDNENYQDVENVKGTVTFGKVAPDPENEKTITKEIEVRNLSGSPSDYNVEVEVTKSAGGDMAAAEVTVDKPSFTLNNMEVLNVTLSIPAGEGSPNNELLGYIHITNGTTKLILPFAASFTGSDDPTGPITHYYLDDYAISPNGDGVLDGTNLRFGVSQAIDLAVVELWDVQNPDGGYFGDGYIGYLNGGSIGVGNWYLPIDGNYIDWGSGVRGPIPEGVYSVDLNDLFTADTLAADGPFYVKTSLPQIEFDDIDEVVTAPEYVVNGAIDDKFIDFKSAVEENLNKDYDVNNKLDVTYKLTNQDGETLEEGTVSLEQDGTFQVPLSKLVPGENTLELTVNDIAGNQAVQAVKILAEEVEDPGEPSEIKITLTQSPTDPTEGPVTVNVDVESDSELGALKWLEGERSVEDFAEAGNDIDLDAKAFEVTENGKYTVYAKNSEGTEAVEVIEISNITPPDEEPEPPVDEPEPPAEEPKITLMPSTTEPTKGPVVVKVDVDYDEELVVLKWLAGEKSVEDFANAGNDIDLAKQAFAVSKNGAYTVYAKFSDDTEKVQMIQISNIIDDDDDGDDDDGDDDGKDDDGTGDDDDKLPDTATPYYNYIAGGLVLLLAGFVSLYLYRRKITA